MKSEKLLGAIGEIDDNLIHGAVNGAPKRKKPVWVKWGAVAACLCLCLLGVLGVNRLLGNYTDTAMLDNGERIIFKKADTVSGASDLAFDVTARPLTEDEAAAVFAGLPVTANAVFRDSDMDTGAQQELIGFEGQIGRVKAVISTSAVPLIDTVIVGTEEASEVNGVSIAAGYFVTRANSRGEQTAIYYASFELGSCKVYLENAGAKNDSEATKNQLTEVIQKLTENGEPDLTSFIGNETNSALDGSPDGYDPHLNGNASDEEVSEQDPAAALFKLPTSKRIIKEGCIYSG